MPRFPSPRCRRIDEGQVELVARVRWDGVGVAVGIRKQAVTPAEVRPVLRGYDATATAGAGVLAGASS
jgi:hypothetical protein